MNFFDVRAETDDDGVRVVGSAFDLRLPPSLAGALDGWDGDSDRLELGVRPEAFEDAALADHVPDGRSIEAHVMVVEPMGPHKDLALRPIGHEDAEGAEFTARVSNDSEVVEGDTIRLAVRIDEVHLFDAVTGENLLV